MARLSGEGGRYGGQQQGGGGVDQCTLQPPVAATQQPLQHTPAGTSLSALNCIFKLFSRLTSQYITHKLSFLSKAEPEPHTDCDSKEEKQHQEAVCARVSNRQGYKGSSNGNKTKIRLKCNKNNECSKKEIYVIPEKPYRTILEESIKNEDVLEIRNVQKRQLNCTGDNNCESFKPVTPHFEYQPKPKEGIFNLSNSTQEIKRIKSVSKYTISFRNLLNNTEITSGLTEEQKENTKKASNQLHDDVSKFSKPQDNLCDTQDGAEEAKIKNYNFPGKETPTKTQAEIKNTNADLCSCLDTHRCLLSMDSDDDNNDGGIEEGTLTLEDDIDDDMEEGLLTTEELASVETGFDDDWLYKAIQRAPIAISA